MEPLTAESFEEWRHHPMTLRLMKMLKSDRENIKEGLVHNIFENEQEAKGRANAVEIILDLEYTDLFPQ